MKTNGIKIVLSALAFGLISCSTLAADTPIYGSQVMTNQERIDHRTKLRAAKTDQEREQVRLEHHEQMKLRAKERGVALPDDPPAQGSGMGPGSGMGQGSGAGMGGGRGR